jgi:predicted acetyltransferase
LVINVAGDDLAPWNNGSWQLQTAPGSDNESQVSESMAAPDIEVSPRALAGLFSGMYSARNLANWGMLTGTVSGIAKADTLFATQYAPHCPDHY